MVMGDIESGSYKIRPAGRHLLTIGRDLIQDPYAAVIELVKNAYDADSPDVEISFIADNLGKYKIIISDHGHGMSLDVVVNKWMVPSTSDKLVRRKSPLGRTLQGRKGIGRFAASILGNDILLETVTKSGDKTTAYIEWTRFEEAEFLNDVEILVETVKKNQPSGTILTIAGNNKLREEWNKDQFDNLIFELKKLKSPTFSEFKNTKQADSFKIVLTVKGFDYFGYESETIVPYPIFDLYDYRIAGQISTDGNGNLLYSLQKIKNASDERIPFSIGKPTDCGVIEFDIRVYDREKESIESLIERGLKDEKGNYVGKLQAKQILNENNGLGVYRNGFRIRPLGDPDFDWLKLNNDRVQNPSMRIGCNQVIGYVLIQSEEQSGLIEKSARDGLRENHSYEQLKKITKSVIAELEARRFNFRDKAGLSRSALKVEKELENLFSFDGLKENVRKLLITHGLKKSIADDIINIINNEATEKSSVAEEIRQAVAIYQGQATLGKIINVILHEGRKPLNYFRNQIPRIRKMTENSAPLNNHKELHDINEILTIIGDNTERFSDLFRRLDPLAAGKRSFKKELRIKKEIENCFAIFRESLESNGITVQINESEAITIEGWGQDFAAIFTNLIDNSIYWLIEKNIKDKAITVNITGKNKKLSYIDYRDTGPGIDSKLIKSEVIFEPQFSTKPSGTGLGLTIAGEAATRNSLELKAYESNKGAYFRLQPL
jgi:signal transduction histidine kinase